MDDVTEYRGYAIRVRTHLARQQSTWHAVYEIMRVGSGTIATTGAVAGAFSSSAEAERAAFAATKLWIDRHATAN